MSVRLVNTPLLDWTTDLFCRTQNTLAASVGTPNPIGKRVFLTRPQIPSVVRCFLTNYYFRFKFHRGLFFFFLTLLPVSKISFVLRDYSCLFKQILFPHFFFAWAVILLHILVYVVHIIHTPLVIIISHTDSLQNWSDKIIKTPNGFFYVLNFLGR